MAFKNALPLLRASTRFHTVDEARGAAKRALPRTVFDYVDGGAEDEVTLRDNRRGFEELTFRQRVAVDTLQPTLSTTVLGTPVSTPVLFAPCGLMGTAHPAAEAAVARVAEAVNTIGVYSTYSSMPLEQIAAAGSGPKWFQLYYLGGRAGAEQLIDRAKAAGYEALVVTVDSIVAGNRERDVANKVSYPLRAGVREARVFGPQVALRPAWLYRFARAGFPLDVANSRPVPGRQAVDVGELISGAPPIWNDLEWIASRWDGPIVVKGVQCAADARRAIDLGASAVVISNHGGRQLDGVPGTIRLLPEVVAEIGADGEVLIDGGVRRGSDVVKALALGARAVMIGRPYIYGLAAGGEAGVAKIYEIFQTELLRTMQLLGCDSVEDLSSEHLWSAAEASSHRVTRNEDDV